MNKQVTKDIELFNRLINGKYLNSGDGYQEYDSVFVFTNEDIKTFFQNVKNGDTALSVLAGGDQLFDLILKGFTKIDTFDINRFTEYATLGLKKTAIENLCYEQYINLYNEPYISNTLLIERLIKCMEPKYCAFWQNYISQFEAILNNNNKNNSDYTSKVCKGAPLMHLIDKFFNIQVDMFQIGYLSSKENYDTLKHNLANSKITFKPGNINRMKFNQKYDFIYLSNIPQNLSFQSSVNVVRSLHENNLNDNGQLAFTYTTFNRLFPPEITDFITFQQDSSFWTFAILDKVYNKQRIRTN